MAAGLAANLTANPFASVTTVTVQIVQLLTGDQEFDSAKTLAAFALGLALFLITLAPQPHRAARRAPISGAIRMTDVRADIRRRCEPSALDDASKPRVRRRYASERRFRAAGLAAVGISVLFLAFLLFTMASKGLGGFIHTKPRCRSISRKSDLFLDPGDAARARTPQQTVAGGRPRGRDLDRPRPPLTVPTRRSMFGDAAVDSARATQIVAQSRHAERQRDLWLPVASNDRHRGQARAAMPQASSWSPAQGNGMRCAAPSTATFLDGVGRDRPVGGRRLGRAQGHAS